jgi:hypothetical protein
LSHRLDIEHVLSGRYSPGGLNLLISNRKAENLIPGPQSSVVNIFFMHQSVGTVTEQQTLD